MFVGRVDELKLIRRQLGRARASSGTATVLALHGLFGAGKTTLLGKIRRVLSEERMVRALFVTNEDIASTSIPEFVYHLASGYQSLDPRFPRFHATETEGRRTRWLQIAGRLGADALPLLQELRSGRLIGVTEESEEERATTESDALILEVALKNQFNNPEDQRLTLDTGDVMAEAFIADMVHTFFPTAEGEEPFPGITGNPDLPFRVVLMIDTYEKITHLVNPWLIESFFPYLFEKRFGDFRNCPVEGMPDGVFVRNLFDVRIVIAGRERLSLTDPERRWDRYRDTLQELRVGPFNEKELAQYLKLNGFDPAEHGERVTELTQGLPYLVALWVDATRADADGTEQAFVNSLAEQRIFWYKTPEQREWIRAAAFLDWFDADALRCFRSVGDKAVEAFEYLRGTSEVARPSRAKQGKFELHEIIRRSLRGSTAQESEERAREFGESAQAFYGAYDLLSRFGPDERQLVRKLAYFNRFDDEALERFYGADAASVRDVIAHEPALFERGSYTTSVQIDAWRALRRYNQSADRSRFQGTLDEVRTIWNDTKARLESAIRERREAIEGAEARIRQLLAEQQMKGDLQQRAHQNLATLENELHIVRRRWRQRLSPREVLVARASFFLSIVFLLTLLFADVLTEDPAIQTSIRTASLVLLLVFIAIFSLMLGRILYNRSRRQEHEVIREDVVSLEGRIVGKQYEFHGLAADAQSAGSEIAALGGKIDEWKREIAEMEGRVLEAYV